MANSSEKYSNDFKETIKVIFNETECSEWYKEFEKKFNKIKDDDDEIIGKYGCSIGAMELMLFIRKRMRDEGLAPSIILENNELEKNSKEHYNFIINSIENYSRKFIERFPCTYNTDIHKKRACIIKEKYDVSYNLIYDYDGWNYENLINQNPEKIKLNSEDWITKERHLYYNELDHYLTYYVGLIKRLIKGQAKQMSCQDPGLKEIKREIELLKNIRKN